MRQWNSQSPVWRRMPDSARDALLHAAAARRMVRAEGLHPLRAFARVSERPVFVIGSPRSGTSFTAETIGSITGFVDLGELGPLKRVLGELAALDPAAAALKIRRIVRTAQRVSLTASLRGIEQTPESTHLIPAIALAFPAVRFIHLIRDGRDVASSLLEKGWLRDIGSDPWNDDAGNPFGANPRFWVEAERRAAFANASEATRAAWVWRQYETVATRELALLPATQSVTLRYEDLVADPSAAARQLASALDADEHVADFVTAFRATRGSALGRWRDQLTADQLADVIAEAGTLLADFGYTD